MAVDLVRCPECDGLGDEWFSLETGEMSARPCPLCEGAGEVDKGRIPAQPAVPELEALRRSLASIEHERWADWQRYMHSLCTRNDDGSLTIPANSVAHWERQIATHYDDLSEREQASDMEQVDRYWPLIAPLIGLQPAAPVDAIARLVAMEEARAAIEWGDRYYAARDAIQPTDTATVRAWLETIKGAGE